MRKQVIFLVVNLISNIFFGQFYQAPTLACAQKETSYITLTWRPPNEPCGAFQKFYIHYASSKAGPFQILDSVSNIGTTTYQHNGISSTQNYCYFMSSLYNCVGLSSKSSDTFCSVATLPTPDLLSISIENNFPVYTWTPLLNYNQVWAYAIFSPTKSIDTVYGYKTNTAIDSSFNVNSGVYTGSVYAMDSCGGAKGRSGFELYHRPCFLSLVNNPCDDEIELNWTRYQGWGPNDEVKEYEIWIKKNSDPEKKEATNDSSSRNFNYNDFDYGDTICIRVKAIHLTIPGVYSFSNQLCFVSTKSQKPDLLQTLSASYVDNYITKIRWYCSPDAIPKSFDLKKSIPRNGNKINLLEDIKFTYEGNGYYSFNDTNGAYDQQINYQLIYEDLCNNKSEGISGNTNFINVTQVGLYTNDIVWPKKLFPDSVRYTVKKNELYFSSDMINYTKIAEPSPNETKYTHNLENLYQSEGKFCYKLISYYSFDTTSQLKDSLFSMSSQMNCILMRTVLWMPNAFKVNGFTPSFKPKMYFFSNVIFKMKIFNRWGIQIFETNNPDTGWNGMMNNGQMASEDSYIYHISYLGNDGVTVDKTGTFVLIK